MRRAPLRGQRNGGWDGSRWRKKALSSLMKSVSCLQKLKSRYCVFCRSGSLSVLVAIKQFELTCGSLLPPIATWRLPSLRVHFAAICFTASTFFRLGFLLCGKEEKTFTCWSNTSSVISQERQERASAGLIKKLWTFFYRIPGQVMFANYRTSSSVLSLYAKQSISRWMRVGFRRSLLQASRKASWNCLKSLLPRRKR